MIKSVNAFIASFWRWWDFMSWQIRVDGHLKIGGAGTWDSLDNSRQNGFLSILQLLSWWQGLLGVRGTDDWDSRRLDFRDLKTLPRQSIMSTLQPRKKVCVAKLKPQIASLQPKLCQRHSILSKTPGAQRLQRHCQWWLKPNGSHWSFKQEG